MKFHFNEIIDLLGRLNNEIFGSIGVRMLRHVLVPLTISYLEKLGLAAASLYFDCKLISKAVVFQAHIICHTSGVFRLSSVCRNEGESEQN
jgi:hypothetical protein